MYANSETQHTQSNREYKGDYRNMGRGGRLYNRGRGRERSFRAIDLSKITCFRCDKDGLFASICPERLPKLQESYENKHDDTQEADDLMMHEVVYLNEKT